MTREISAGGVVVRRTAEGWSVAIIEPRTEEKKGAGKRAGSKRAATKEKLVRALPKGLVDPGEKPEQTAVREVLEETGVTALPVAKLADIKYVYVRSWGDKQRVFKVVSFYLMRYEAGVIDEISPAMRIEVKRAFWIPLQEALQTLAYKGEREVAQRACEYVESHPEL
jgi:8-oxo-dGTP pyrophosphatase MutT (NUDIX family)